MRKIIILLWIFATVILLPMVFADCSPSTCPSGSTDNGISCNSTHCVRDCTIGMCSTTWTLDSSDYCNIYSTGSNSDEEDCETATYTPTNTSRCYKFIYDSTSASVQMLVTDPIDPDGPADDCDSEAIGGFYDTTGISHPWFENMTDYNGYVSDDEPLINYLLKTMRAHAQADDDATYRDDATQEYTLYCSPSEYACDNISSYQDKCDTGCYNQATRINVWQGYVKDYDSGDEEWSDNDYNLYYNARCGSDTVDSNAINDYNYFRVYSSDLTGIHQDQICEIYTPVASNVKVIYENSTAGDDLICNYTFYDLHNFIEQNSTYEWWKNGINQNINYKILQKGNLTPNDIWYCKVSPNNGIENGTKVQSSNSITILSTLRNPKFYVENELVWNYSNYFKGKEVITDFNSELTNALETCIPDAQGYCNISLTFSSDAAGKLNVSGLEIYYEVASPNKVFVVQNSSSSNAAYFDDQGNIVLKGNCTQSASCTAPADSFIFKDSAGNEVAHISPNGNLCIETGDCSGQSASCNPANDAFIIQDSSGNNVSYIDSTNGDLCLTGTLVQNGNP